MQEFRDIENKIAAKAKEVANQETGLRRFKNELEAKREEHKRSEEEERQCAEAARKIHAQELFPDKNAKQLNAKLTQLKKRKLLAMEKEGEKNVEAFVTEYNEMR